MTTIQIWFDFASTYSYPALVQMYQQRQHFHLTIHPFLLGGIFQKQGWNDSPFNLYPAKGQYMWRDMARICQQENLSFQQPSQFPRNGLFAARITQRFAKEEWIWDFILTVYQANFVEDLDIGQKDVIINILQALNLDADAIYDAANTDENKNVLKLNGIQAEQLGIFGAPSFIVDGELFWGHDRLEYVLNWAKKLNK